MRIAEGSVVADRFEVVTRAGVGGMAEVFLARDQHTGREVALKILRVIDEPTNARFAREASMLATLSHPRLVAYVDHGSTAEGRRWIAMEWLEGETLAERLGRQPLRTRESLAIARGVAEGLAEAHRRDVIHRDVKPSNIFLVNRSPAEVRLLDFGIARWTHHASDLTETGARIGTFAYMSPEQAWGRRNLAPATDVFSLGCVLFACLTGRKPFAAKHSTAVLAKILLEPPPRVTSVQPGIPPELDDLVARMMSKEPEQRIADGAAVLSALDRLNMADDERVSLPMEEPTEALTSSERRVVTLVLAGGLALAEDATPPTQAAHDATLVEGEDHRVWASLRETARAHGARLDALADGTLVASFASSAGPIEHALRAASFAQRLRETAPDASIVMATGLARSSGDLPFGELIDSAVASLRRAGAAEIRIDDVSAGLLGTRFEIAGDERGLRLVGPRDVVSEQRLFLGKESPFVGRRRELKTLEALYEESAEECVARVALVTGAAGLGKSRLRHELLARLGSGQPTPTVIIARADPLTAGSPLGLLADAVRRTAQIRDGELPAVRHRRLRARLARPLGGDPVGLERCAIFLGELAGASSTDSNVGIELAAARMDPRLMGDRMQEAFEEWIAAESRLAPVLIVLEDLQWGDLPTVSFIDAALQHLAERPWMVLALARPEVHDRFPRLWVGRDIQELRLPGLTRKAGLELARTVLGESCDEVIIEELVERAQGNAFYLEELIRTVAEGRGDELPPTVLAMVQARLEGLPEEGRRILRAASVFGKTFWRGGLFTLLGGAERTSSLDGWLHDFEKRELVTAGTESRFPGERDYVFRAALLREGAYAMLTDEDREKGHRLAAQWLLDAGEPDPWILALHFERGGEPELAAPHFLRAAEQALEASDLESAIDLAERAVAGAGEELRGSARLVQAEAHRWRGESALALERGREAAELLTEGSARWYRAVTEAQVASVNQQKTDDVAELVERAVRATALDGADLPRGIFACRGAQLRDFERTGVLALFDEVRGLATDQAPLLRGWVCASEAGRATKMGDIGFAVRAWAEGLEAFERAGDKRNACTQRMNAGYLLGVLGSYEDSERMLWDAHRTAEQLGLAQTASWALHNLGLVVARLGRVEEGLAIERRALSAGEVQGNSVLEAISHGYLAWIELLAGRPEATVTHAHRAFELLARLPNAQTFSLVMGARGHLAAGHVDEALAIGERALSSFERHGIDEYEPLLHLTLAECYDAVGRLDQGAMAARRGRDSLLASAAKITDRRLREQHCSRVSENAALLARAERGSPS